MTAGAALFLQHNDGTAPGAEDDRKWFEARPHRRHRIREHVPGEWHVAQLGELPTGWRWFTAVRRAAPGIRLRLPLAMEGQPATGERAAARLFEIGRDRGGIFAPMPEREDI